MAIGIEHIAPLLPADWPGAKLRVMPGDLSRYMTGGFGGDVPVVVRPWDKLENLDRQQSYYGLDAPEADPIRAAPTSDSSGGCLYFDDAVKPDDLLTALRVAGLHAQLDDYVVFGSESADPRRDRYLDQIRIIERGALSHLFRAPAAALEGVARPAAKLGELATAFVAAQRAKWNDPDYTFSGKLSGTLGGDGDWAKEALAFGFLMENKYWQVMRLWSRPWLVTK